jgi:hypothetical protein
MAGVRGELHDDVGEVAVTMPAGEQRTCLKTVEPFGITIARLSPVTVLSAFNRFRHAPVRGVDRVRRR